MLELGVPADVSANDALTSHGFPPHCTSAQHQTSPVHEGAYLTVLCLLCTRAMHGHSLVLFLHLCPCFATGCCCHQCHHDHVHRWFSLPGVQPLWADPVRLRCCAGPAGVHHHLVQSAADVPADQASGKAQRDCVHDGGADGETWLLWMCSCIVSG